MSDTTLGWHFVGETLRDGRPVPPLERGPHQPARPAGTCPARILQQL